MKIMVFLQGTILMHRNAVGRPREERVRQVVTSDESISDFATYVPVGNAVQILRAWQEQGADIVYLSSRQTAEDAEVDESVLKTHGFPAGPIFFRQPGEKYHDLPERVLPDILIEDDCESIGGEAQMTYPYIAPEFKSRIKSIVVKEFGGLDELPNSLRALASD